MRREINQLCSGNTEVGHDKTDLNLILSLLGFSSFEIKSHIVGI